MSISRFLGEEYLEVTWLGRGGQGAVTASELIAAAAILEGKNANAIPEFGAERRGAPVRAYTRISFGFKELPKTPIINPHIVVLLDPSLLKLIPSFVKPRENAILVANTTKSIDEIIEVTGELFKKENIFTVNATAIALNTIGKPIFNTPMTGAFVKVVPVVKLESLLTIIKKYFPGKLGEANAQAAQLSYEKVMSREVNTLV